ncbi:MAG: hypothetical protein GVY32_04985 [Gammaproteobacteria bacterium]|jgi:hypothetical protein|nr:hypothetical protein [Gammaproteobacteria bacterium]
MRHSLRLVTLLMLVALLGGCGVKTVYNNADWLVMRWVEDRVDLTAEQDKMLRASLDEHLAWHCASELPAYAAFLRQVDRDVVAGRIDEETLERYQTQVTDFGRRLLAHIRPTVIDLLASLDDEQVTRLLDSFEERNRELREEAESYAEASAVEARAENMEKGMRRFSGRLTDTQRARLRQWAGALDPTAEMALQQRLRWQAEFAGALRMRHEPRRFEAAIAALLEPGRFTNEALERRRETNRDRTIETIAAIHGIAPERQIDRLRDNLADFSRDLEQLSCS